MKPNMTPCAAACRRGVYTKPTGCHCAPRQFSASLPPGWTPEQLAMKSERQADRTASRCCGVGACAATPWISSVMDSAANANSLRNLDMTQLPTKRRLSLHPYVKPLNWNQGEIVRYPLRETRSVCRLAPIDDWQVSKVVAGAGLDALRVRTDARLMQTVEQSG